MSKIENPPAFPTLLKSGELAVSEGGMSLRDYFAGQALAGILASPTLLGDDARHLRAVALAAYNYANAMLAERAKTEGK